MIHDGRFKQFLKSGFIFAFLSAVFFSLNVPVAKWLLLEISPYWLASLFYLGAGVGTYIFQRWQKASQVTVTQQQHKTIWIIMMIGLDVFAPILFFLGVQGTQGSVVGLLSNAELLFTLVFAFVLFKESINLKTLLSFGLIIMAVFVNHADQSWIMTIPQVWIILATLMWGLENNISKKLSSGNPFEVVIVKGLATAFGTAMIALILKEPISDIEWVIIAIVFGFLIYGISLIFYVFAQRNLGAAPVQIIQSFSPLLGGIIAMILFQELMPITRWISYAFILFALGLLGLEAWQQSHLKKESVSTHSNRNLNKNSIK